MTLLKNLIGFIALTTLLFACKKEMSTEGVKSPVVIESAWQFTESGKTFIGDIDTAYINEGTGFNILTLEGTTEDGTTGQIILEVAGETIIPGSYTGDFVNFLYGENGELIYKSIPGGSDFSIVITAIDSASVTGTFSGTVKDANENDKTIVDGKFTAPIGRENFDIIQPNPASEDYFQLGTKWEYENTIDASDKVIITNIGDTTINVDGTDYEYAIFENDRTGQHRYYRKDGNNFYEYSLVTLGGDTSPEELDLIILKQDGEVGDNWDSREYTVSVSGIPSLKAKINASIVAKGYSSKLDGIKYENLMQVDQQLYIELDTTFEPSPDDILTTIYSRGIGVVQYYDLTLEGLYILKSYTP